MSKEAERVLAEEGILSRLTVPRLYSNTPARHAFPPPIPSGCKVRPTQSQVKTRQKKQVHTEEAHTHCHFAHPARPGYLDPTEMEQQLHQPVGLQDHPHYHGYSQPSDHASIQTSLGLPVPGSTSASGAALTSQPHAYFTQNLQPYTHWYRPVLEAPFLQNHAAYHAGTQAFAFITAPGVWLTETIHEPREPSTIGVNFIHWGQLQPDCSATGQAGADSLASGPTHTQARSSHDETDVVDSEADLRELIALQVSAFLTEDRD